MASAVGNRYARALVELVLAPRSPLKPEEAGAQLRAVEQMVAGSPELRVALLTPAIQTSRKRAVMLRLLDEMRVSSLIRNFIFVVIDHRRIAAISEIREAFEALADERQGFVRAEVTSATTLDDSRRGDLERELSRLTGKRVRLRFAIDPQLLGGALARIGSVMYDGSVRGGLQQMRRKLIEQSAE